MAYNGFIRFAPDLLYEITEDGEDIAILRNGEPVGGGSDLPTVTAEDNGDVLTVVEGEWAKAAPSGGKTLLISETCVSEDDYIYHTLNKTWREIHDAISNGYLVYLLENITSSEYNVRFVFNVKVDTEPDDYQVRIFNPMHSNDWIYHAQSQDDYPVFEEED